MYSQLVEIYFRAFSQVLSPFIKVQHLVFSKALLQLQRNRVRAQVSPSSSHTYLHTYIYIYMYIYIIR